MKDFINLNSILESTKNKTISLPTVQRGFVWKPYQIENLWDSLLRGYPIGSFVLSQKINTEEYELLDGQQRASAICLGFYNPLDKCNDVSKTNNEIFKTSFENIIIFIDLVKPNPNNDNRKFLFRVITKSHPWGYRRQENQKVLEAKNITKAMSFYKIENNDYLHKPLNEFYPFDSYEPIPLGLFINASINNLSTEDLEKEIDGWKKKLPLNDKGELKVIKERNEENIDSFSIKEIYSLVKKMLDKQKIPLLFLNLLELYEDDVNNIAVKQIKEDVIESDEDEEKLEDNEQTKSEDRNIDEIENLFIRLNSGGTPLRGEELNYSILKSHISSKLQKKIEDKCKGIFYPARFLTIVFRLFNNRQDQNNENETDSINMKIKPKQFQKIMREKKKDDFIEFIESFIDSDNIEKTKKLLLYHNETNKIGLPTFIAYSLADKAPEIMFMLLYRLFIKKDIITADLKPNVLGIITLFTWLGKVEKQRDHSKLLNNIWLCIKTFETERFWTSETVQRAMIKDYDNEILTKFPKLNELKKIIPKPNADIRTFAWGKMVSNSDYGNFIDKIFYNKDLILYAQRDAITEWFQEIEDCNLEDTNRAFDWDHICPNSYIHNKRNINQALKDWYHSNGNFRAWKYSLNRIDQDDTPSEKLNPKENLKWWAESLDKNYTTERQLKDALLLLSFCDKEWLNLNSDVKKRIKDRNISKQIISYILNRNIKICVEWYEQLKINELIPETPKVKDIKALFESIINNKMWNERKENDVVYYSSPIGDRNLFLFFSFNIENNALIENGTNFGIWEENTSQILIKIKIPQKKGDKYFYYDDSLYGEFTLMSFSENSLVYLFNQFYLWLTELPDKKIKDSAIDKFNNSIKSKYQNKILMRKDTVETNASR